jgi:hypothetical protein
VKITAIKFTSAQFRRWRKVQTFGEDQLARRIESNLRTMEKTRLDRSRDILREWIIEDLNALQRARS